MVDLVRQELVVSNCAMAHQANKHHRDCDLIVCDYAWLSTGHFILVYGLIRKLASHFIGLYRVVKQINHISFKLELPIFLACASSFVLFSAKKKA